MFHCFSSIYFVSSWSFCYCFDDFSMFSLVFTRARRENSHTILCFSARVFLDAEQDDLRFQQRWLVAKARKIRQLFFLCPKSNFEASARSRQYIYFEEIERKKISLLKADSWLSRLLWRWAASHYTVFFCAHRSRVLWPKRRWSNVREKRVFLIFKDFLRESWVFLVWKSSHNNKNKRKWERKIQQIVMIILLLFSH